MSNSSKKHIDIQALIQDIIKAKKNEFIKNSSSTNKSNPGIHPNMKTEGGSIQENNNSEEDHDINLNDEFSSKKQGKQEDTSDKHVESNANNSEEINDKPNDNPKKKRVKYRYVSFEEEDPVSEEQIKKELTLFCQNGTKTILDAIYAFDVDVLRSKMNKTSNIYVKEMSDNMPKNTSNNSVPPEGLKIEIEEILPTELDIYKDFRELMDEHNDILTESENLSPFDFIRKYETYFCIDHNSFNVQLDLASIELVSPIKHVNECKHFPKEYADFLKSFSENKHNPYKTTCVHPYHRMGITMAIIIYNMKLFASRIAGKYMALRNNILTYYDSKPDLKSQERKYNVMHNYYKRSLETIKEKDREIKELMIVIRRVGEFETRFHSSTKLIKELKVLLSAERLTIINYEKDMKQLEYSHNVSQSHLSETKEHIIKLNKDKKSLNRKCSNLSHELSLMKDRLDEKEDEIKLTSENEDNPMIFSDIVKSPENLSGSQSDDTISSYCSADSACEHVKNVNSANDIIAKLMTDLVDQKRINKKQNNELQSISTEYESTIKNMSLIKKTKDELEIELQSIMTEHENCKKTISDLETKNQENSNKIEVLENTIKNLRLERSRNVSINNRNQKDKDDFNNVIICQNRDMAAMRNKITTDTENIKELNKQIELLNNNFANVYNPSDESDLDSNKNSISTPSQDPSPTQDPSQPQDPSHQSQNPSPSHQSRPPSTSIQVEKMLKIILSNSHLYQQMMTQKVNTVLNNESERINVRHSMNTDNIMRLDHIHQTTTNNNIMLRSIHEMIAAMNYRQNTASPSFSSQASYSPPPPFIPSSTDQ